ncbi:MAG TPA: nuclear transport factor 2 family protein [Chloroflexota bacterium]|nr:nuclear transport factor 2 family protein [Chloroflexota bacterium]
MRPVNGPSRERDWLGYRWSAWMPLMAAHPLALAQLPDAPGIYRVRRSGAGGLLWVGPAEGGVRAAVERLSRQVHLPVPPYDDPAHPARRLWSLRRMGAAFEVSGADVPDPIAAAARARRTMVEGERRVSEEDVVSESNDLDIIGLERALWAAIAGRQEERIAGLLTDDFLYVSPAGIHDKGQTLQTFSETVLSWHTLDGFRVVRPTADSAVVTYHVIETVRPADRPDNAVQSGAFATSVWAQLEEGWRLVVHSEAADGQPANLGPA